MTKIEFEPLNELVKVYLNLDVRVGEASFEQEADITGIITEHYRQIEREVADVLGLDS